MLFEIQNQDNDGDWHTVKPINIVSRKQMNLWTQMVAIAGQYCRRGVPTRILQWVSIAGQKHDINIWENGEWKVNPMSILI